MDILFVYYYPSGGVETLARQRSHALKIYDINFHFLYYKQGPGIQNINSNSTFITNKDSEIQEIINNGHYEVIIVCSDHSFLPRVRNMNFKGKLIYEVQGLGSFLEAEEWLRQAQPYVEANADAILLPKTPHLIELTEKYYPLIKKFSFHNCIDINMFSYKKTNREEIYPVIGWVGRIEENKNWKGFLEIGYELVKINPLIKLWMFIDSSLTSANQENQFKNTINEYKLNNNLHIHDNVPHQKMPEYYSIIRDSGGFLCSTSKVEGFGYAIVEAMSCRCPVLTTDSDGIKSFVIHNYTGKIYPHDNIKAATEEAKILLFNNALRQKISLHAQRYIYTYFTPRKYAKSFIKMLRELGVYTK
ncbi:glycosyl transferase family 1 [Priestia megaterium]|uniref:glycosyltransferase family 4 protein n=1 Tax=Priestia megaterium TaxID=1404 RepID=UPI000BFA2EB2|nr:glycosyltransferase [Priestia megaterium]PFB01110.1 glycosyl transferase family 1 [Priestia megaterium]